jgi:hypothetical protein
MNDSRRAGCPQSRGAFQSPERERGIGFVGNGPVACAPGSDSCRTVVHDGLIACPPGRGRPGSLWRRSVLSPSCLVCIAALILAGCEAFQQGGGDNELGRAHEQIQAQKEHIEKLENDLIAAKATIDHQAEQIHTLLDLGDARMSKLIVPVEIRLTRMTGGYENDDVPGDDGVIAYVQPIDADGDVVKVAGSLEMDVFDLANPSAESLVAHAELDVDNTRKAWHGRLWTNHFTIKCPWPPPNRTPPKHRELTVRVRFTDYLTGNVLTAQMTCEIKLPADAQAAAR